MRKRVRKKQRNVLSKEQFFEELSTYCNYIDKETVQTFYYGLIKLLSRELRVKGSVRMPDWGDFLIALFQNKRALNINTGKVHMLPIKKVVKYEADYKLKNYFHSQTVSSEEVNEMLK